MNKNSLKLFTKTFLLIKDITLCFQRKIGSGENLREQKGLYFNLGDFKFDIE